MNKALAYGATVLLGLALTSCSSGGNPPIAASSVAPIDSPSVAAAAPSHQASPPTKAQDEAALKRAIVTAANLGKPWVQPASVSTVKHKRNEPCPGHLSATEKLPNRPQVSRVFTEGKGVGVNIGYFVLSTIPEPDGAALTKAYAADTASCASYRDANKLFVTRTPEGPTAASHADQIVSTWAERIYYDKAHHQLAYARHVLVGRTGRVVVQVEYAFLTQKSDRGAKDFARATRLLEKQLAKISTVFGG
jgi:hypothetical protein